MPSIFADPSSYEYAHTEKRWSVPSSGQDLQVESMVHPSGRRIVHPLRQLSRPSPLSQQFKMPDVMRGPSSGQNDPRMIRGSPSRMGDGSVISPVQPECGSASRLQQVVQKGRKQTAWGPTAGAIVPRRNYEQIRASGVSDRPAKRRARPLRTPIGGPFVQPDSFPLLPTRTSTLSALQQRDHQPIQQHPRNVMTPGGGVEMRISNSNSPIELERRFPVTQYTGGPSGAGPVGLVQTSSTHAFAAAASEHVNLNDWFVFVAHSDFLLSVIDC
jgi:hypothetical protein